MVRIKKLGIENVKVARALLVRTFAGLSDQYYPAEFMVEQKEVYTEAVIGRKLARPDGVSFGAFDGKKLQGFILAFPMSAGLFFVEWVVVASSARRSGLLGKLLKRVEQTAKRKKGHKIYLYTSLKNIPAARAYQKYGFSIEGVLRNHFSGVDFLMFGKTLSRRTFSAEYRNHPDFEV